MSTSLFEGRILQPAAVRAGAGDDPVGALRTQVLASNVAHLADELAQVHVSLMTSPLAVTVEPTVYVDYLEPIAGAGGVWRYVGAFTSPRARAIVRADGTPYPCRVRVVGSTSNVAGEVEWLVTVGLDLARLLEDAEVPASDACYRTDPTSSTSAVALDGASCGAAAYPSLLVPAIVPLADDEARVFDAVAGATPARKPGTALLVRVWARSSHASATPRLRGLFVGEYCGT